jgi:hypothetical protein
VSERPQPGEEGYVEEMFKYEDLYDRLMDELSTGAAPSLSVKEHVRASLHAAIIADPEPWQSSMFFFVRCLRSHPDLGALSAADAWDEISAPFADWETVLETVLDTYDDVDAAEAEFHTCWPKIRCPTGREPIQEAYHRAHDEPIIFDPDRISQNTAKYKLFLSLSGWLQVCIGPSSIFLPVRKIAQLVGVSTYTISMYRGLAVEDGFLFETEKHTAKKATAPSIRSLAAPKAKSKM